MAGKGRIVQNVAGIGKVPRGGGSAPVKSGSDKNTTFGQGSPPKSSGPIRGKASNPTSPSMAFGTGMTQGTRSVNNVATSAGAATRAGAIKGGTSKSNLGPQ